MTRYFGERFTFQSNIPYVVFMSVIISLRSSSQSQSMVILLGKHLYLPPVVAVVFTIQETDFFKQTVLS